ncbi:tetratricopeptide repeat protein [Breoghania sp.]|uniref:tetratricopeptide repeat protein n=1 Tax=Breoghania sp. TaxID=2065378 RepID=UPI00260BFE6B|nr:tetratricopeptide repeat protein [Breoghania sp.]MDJ0930211.1 tetratricopeptide repeat protein [Breoghania sp.]
MNARSRTCLAGLAARARAPAAFHALLPLTYAEDARSGDKGPRRTEDLEEALALARRAVALTPESAHAHQALEAVLVLLGKSQDALEAGRRALELNPNDPDIMATHGGALVMNGNYKDGLALLIRADRLSPDHPEWYTVMTVFGAVGAGRQNLAEAEARNLMRSGSLSALLARLLVAQAAEDRGRVRMLTRALRRFSGFFGGSEVRPALCSALASPASTPSCGGSHGPEHATLSRPAPLPPFRFRNVPC